MDNNKKSPEIKGAINLRSKMYEDLAQIDSSIPNINDKDLLESNKYYDEYDPAIALQNAAVNQEEVDSADSGLSASELVWNGVKSFMVGVNDAQIGNTQGIIRREIVPELDKVNNNLSLFEQYDDLSNQLADIQRSLSVSNDPQLLVKRAGLTKQLNETVSQLSSLGVSKTLNNAEDIQNELIASKTKLENKLAEYHKDIETDEDDKTSWDTMSPEYKAAQDLNRDFKWSEPSKWMYTLPNTLGSSSSAWAYQVAPYASTFVKQFVTKGLAKVAAGAAAGASAGGVGAIPGVIAGGVSAAVDVTNAGIMLYSNYKQSENEANAEVADNVKQRVVGLLGENILNIAADARSNPELSDAVKNLSDDQIIDRMLDRRLPADPRVTEAANSIPQGSLDRLFNQNMAITFASNIAQDLLFVPYVGKIVGKKGTAALKGASLASSPIEGLGDIASEGIKKQMTKYLLGRDAVAGKTAKYLAKTAYVAGDILPKVAATALSEGVEEGAQYTSGAKFQSGLYDNNSTEDLGLSKLASAVSGAYGEKLTTFANILGSPIGYTNALYENDTEYWNNVKLGAAASLFSPLQVAMTGVGARSDYKETKGMDLVNELAKNEIASKEEMEKVIGYASGKLKGYESDVLNAFEQLRDNKDIRPAGLTEEDIQEEIDLANKAFNLTNNKKFVDLANTLDIKQESQEFGELAGLAIQAEKEFKESRNNLEGANKQLNTASDVLKLSESFNDIYNNDIVSKVSEINDSNKDGNANPITAQQFSDVLFNYYINSKSLDNSIEEINKLLSSEDSNINFNDSPYTKAQLKDLRHRFVIQKNAIEKSKPEWFNKQDGDNIENSLRSFLDISEIDNYYKKLQQYQIAAATVERNQQIIRSFGGNVTNIGTEGVEFLNALKERKGINKFRTAYKKVKKDIVNQNNAKGVELISELLDLYHEKRSESKTQLEAVTGVVEKKEPVKIVEAPRIVTTTKVKPTVVKPAVEEGFAPEPIAKSTTKARVKSSKPKTPVMPQSGDLSSIVDLANEELGGIPKSRAPEKSPTITTNSDAIQQSAEIKDSESTQEDDWFGVEGDAIASSAAMPEPSEGSSKKTKTKSTTGKKITKKSKKETATQEATSSELTEKEQAQADFKSALDELKDLWGQADKIGFAFDPEKEANRQAALTKAGFKLMTASFKLGMYKFKDFITQILNTSNDESFVRDNFENFKGIYANQYFSSIDNRNKMDRPGDLEGITYSDIFNPEPSPLTLGEKEVEQASGVGAEDHVNNPLPDNAISDQQLLEFDIDGTLGILNTFHYDPNTEIGEKIEFEDGRIIQFDSNSKLPELFNSDPTGFTYHYDIANFTIWKTGKKKVDWKNPKTWNEARVGVVAVHGKSNQRFWITLRRPSQLVNIAMDSDEYVQMSKALEDRRSEIISKFIDKDGKYMSDVIIRPTRTLLHNAVSSNINSVKPLTDTTLNRVFQLSTNLDDELKNFAFSGASEIEPLKMLNGTYNIYDFKFPTTAGGVFYLISPEKRISGRPIPVKLTMKRFSSEETLANILSELVFDNTLADTEIMITDKRFKDTDLYPSDILKLFLNYGKSTIVYENSQLEGDLKLNKIEKQLYVDKGALHYGSNVVRKAGLSEEQLSSEKAAFADWVMSTASVPFRTNPEKNSFTVVTLVKDMFNGRLSSSIERLGSVEIVKGISFTKEDLNHSLLAWMIKNNMIQSNLNADRYLKPYVIADGITMETSGQGNVAEPTTTVQPSIEPVKVEERPKKRRKFINTSFDDVVTVDFHRSLRYSRKNETLNINNARKFLKEKLGMTDEQIHYVDMGLAAEASNKPVSHMTKDVITLVSTDEVGVEYHEAFHRISLLTLSNSERNTLYNAFRKSNPQYKNATDKQIEEELAEGFRYYMNTKSSKWYYGVTRFLNKIKTFIDTIRGDYNIEGLYRRINEGRYYNISPNPESVARFKEAYGTRANFTQRGHAFQNVKSLDDYNQVVEYFAITAIEDSLAAEEGTVITDISRVRFDYAVMKEELLDSSVDTTIPEQQRLVYKELHDNFDTVLRPDIESFAEGLNLRQIEEEELYSDEEERDGGEIERDNFDKYDASSYEMSKLHNIRPAVKLFLSSIKERIEKDGKYYALINTKTGLPQVTPFATAWKRIVNQIFDADSFGDVMYKLAKLAKSDPFYASVYAKLKSVGDVNLQTQILQTITGYRHTFLTVSFDSQSVGDRTVYISTLGGSVDNRNAKKIVGDWNRNFFNSEFVVTNDKGERVPDKKALAYKNKEFFGIIQELVKLNNNASNIEYDNILYKFESFLNSIGISIDYDTLNQLVVNKLITMNTVDKPSMIEAAKLLFANTYEKGGLAKTLPTLLTQPVFVSTNSNIRSRNIENLFTDEPFALAMAMIYYKKNSNNLEEKQFGPKNSTLYPLSKHNYLTLEINKLNKDKKYVSELLSIPYNNSSIVLNKIKGNSTTKLKVGTLININEFYGGTGVDYQSAPLVETFIAKYTLSEKDILLLPTMSDKKTYMPIEGITLFSKNSIKYKVENDEIESTISNAVVNQFYKYYMSEYQAIAQYNRLKQNEDQIPLNNRIPAYIGKKGKAGNGGRFRILRGYYRMEEGKTVYHSFSDMSVEEINDYFNNQAQMEEDIKVMLNKKIDEHIEYARELGIIDKQGDKLINVSLPNNGLDKRIVNLQNGIEALSNDSKTAASLAIRESIAGLTINQFVSMFEAEKILHKDVAFYKNYPDVSKRLAGVLSTGDRARTDFPEEHFMSKIPRFKAGKFKVSGMKDIVMRANEPLEMYKAVYNAYAIEYLENTNMYTPEQINDFVTDDMFMNDNIPVDIAQQAKAATERDLSLYVRATRTENGEIIIDEDDKPINQADASVYVSPLMYKAILATQGMLNADVEAAIDFIEAHPDGIGDKVSYAKTLAAAMHPLKMIYFGSDIVTTNIDGKAETLNVPIFNKMAIFPLFKAFTSGDLKYLYDRMTDPIDPIDMMTTKSSVKVGNMEEYEFYTDATQGALSEWFTKDKNGNYPVLATRLQSFSNLLNQMPIEAHDAERRMLVTQAMKTVYSNIRLEGSYTLPSSGRTVTGMEMRDLAMAAINRLSDIGLKNIINQLNVKVDENGSYSFSDFKGLSEKLQRDAASSGMDTDIRESLGLNEDGEFIIPLSASPVSKQLTTKIISGVNKETVDINLPGGTFVQMSSFGLKAIETDVTISEAQAEIGKAYKINNGRRLKIKNKDNSMDCVISINLLKHFIPNYDQMSFMEARQWLFDNNIIGDSAAPTAMGYRVPTQGMSSIAALKIKDILPSQIGDTIILPDEFTARTGSDFDIDKLFLTRYNFKVTPTEFDIENMPSDVRKKALDGFDEWMDETLGVDDKGIINRRRGYKSIAEAQNDYIATKKTGYTLDKSTGLFSKRIPIKYKAEKYEYDFNKPVEENSKNAIENLLVDTFMASLLDNKNVHDTLRPLDVPVGIAKGVDKKYTKKDNNKEALLEYSLMYQDRVKQDFADSKSGIGPFALNNPHHVLGQLVQLVMNLPEYMSELRNLHKVTGADGIHILDWLSAMISAHVDVAKDNYIINLNVNSYTYNTTNFLFRTGAGTNTLLFVDQPIMKALAEAYIQSKGTYGFDKSTTPTTRFKNKEKTLGKKLIEKANKLASTSEEKAKLKELVSNDKLSDSILFEPTIEGKLNFLETLLDKDANDKKDFDFYYGQLYVYKLHKQMLPAAEAMSNLVKASQIDTKKFGKNAIQMREFLRSVDKMYDSPYFSASQVENLFNKTFLAKKLQNSVKFTLDLLSKVNIPSKQSYYKLYRGFVNSAGLSQISGDRSITEITNAIDNAWRSFSLYSSTGSNYLLPNDNPVESIRSLFIGDKSIAKRINNLKQDIISSQGTEKYPEISITNGRISNLFLNSLTGITSDNIDYLRVDYSDDISSNVSRQIREYWQELIDSKNEELHQLGLDLVRYAVFSGHGMRHLNSMFDFIPTRALQDLGYYENVRNIEAMNDKDFAAMFNRDDIEEIYRNNWTNNTLVPIVKPKAVKMSQRKVNGKVLVAPFAIIGTGRRALTKDEDGIEIYSPFVKVKTRNKSVSGGYQVFKFIGTYSKTVGKKTTTEPLYVLTNKKGIKEGGKAVVTEYVSSVTTNDVNTARESAIPGNNQAPKYRDKETGMISYLEDNTEHIKLIVDEYAKRFGTFDYADPIQYMFGDNFPINEDVEGAESIDENDEEIPNVVDTEDTTQENSIVESVKEINIYAGTGENAELSNFAIRPFDVELGYDSDPDIASLFGSYHPVLPPEFKSVEQAFQYFKFIQAVVGTDYFTEQIGLDVDATSESYKYGEKVMSHATKILKETSGATIKRLGGMRGILKQEDVANWDKMKSSIMKTLLLQSFRQNPEALQKLLETGDATLTHTQDKSAWGTEFPRILMEVRDVLQDSEGLSNNEFNDNNDYPTDAMNHCKD